MNTLMKTALIVILWCINIFNGTGLDSVYHVTQKTKIIVIAITIVAFLIRKNKDGKILVEKNDFIIFVGMFLSFSLSVYKAGYGFQAIDYLWIILLIYLLSGFNMNEKVFYQVGLICGIGGCIVLFIYDKSSILSGWNENSIAMIGMQSFLLLLIPLCFEKSLIRKIFLLVMSYIYIIFIMPTDSRSSILFVIVGVLFAFNVISPKIFCNKNGKIIFFLLVPLMVALLVIVISNTSVFVNLEAWSYKQFQKPIFNGRDYIWRTGIDSFAENILFGAGTISINGWHNSAITCLVTYGLIGYIFWISCFKNIIMRSIEWMYDRIVQGCIVAFFLLYLQQSVSIPGGFTPQFRMVETDVPI